MARPAYTDKFHGKLAALKIVNRASAEAAEQEALGAPLPQLDELWHYECVVSPRSPAAKPQSNPCSPRSPSPAPDSYADGISPRSASKVASPHLVRSASGKSNLSPPLSPRSHASSSGSAPSPLSRFAPAQRALAQRVFSTFDENGDGSVSTHEISRMFEKLGLSRAEDSLTSLLQEMPNLVTKAEGEVDEEEFVLLYELACCFVDANASSSSVNGDVDKDLLAAFQVFDKDGNGFISPTELQTVLCSLGFPQAGQLDACVDMIARFDENGDGHVDFFEFKKLFHMDNPFMTTIPTF